MNLRLGLFLCAALGVSVGCASPPSDQPDTTKPTRRGATPVRFCDGASCEVFASFDGAVQTLNFDDDHVFALVRTEKDPEALVVTPVAGGPSTTLATAVGIDANVLGRSHDTIGVADGFAFFGDQRGLERVPISEGRPELVADSGHLMITSVVTDPTALVAGVANEETGHFFVLPLHGAKAPKLDAGGKYSTMPVALLLDAENVYWDDSLFPPTSLHASPRDGGPSRVLLRTNQIIGVAFDDTFAYVAEGGLDKKGHVDGAILKVPLAGGPPTTLLAIDHLPGSIQDTAGLAVDSAFVYFALGDTVFALPKDGGERVPFVNVAAIYIAASKTHVYFVPRESPTVLLRQPKLAP